MFGWKNKYNDLLSKYQHLQDDCKLWEDRYKTEIEQQNKSEHPVNELCEGCKNLITRTEQKYGVFGAQMEVIKYEEKKFYCKLDNKCKDYTTE